MTPALEIPLGDVSPQVTLVSSKTADSYARLRPPSEKPPSNAGPRMTQVSGSTGDSCARLGPPSEKSLGSAGLRVMQVSGNTEDSCARLRPPSARSLGNVGPRGSNVPDIPDDSHTRLRPPGRRQRSQRWIPNTAIHVAARLTKQDTRRAAGAVLMDGRPAMLPVSVDVSSIDIQKVRHAESPTEPFVANAERRQEFGAPVWLDDIDPE